tara:strand:- start:464 stop:898 length:435 start_codon:yes stop_codon:yes gene_type:complete
VKKFTITEEELAGVFKDIQHFKDSLVDLLEEWSDVVGAKELEDNEVGFNGDRLNLLLDLLSKSGLDQEPMKVNIFIDDSWDYNKKFTVEVKGESNNLSGSFLTAHSDNWEDENPSEEEMTSSIKSEIMAFLQDARLEVRVTDED